MAPNHFRIFISSPSDVVAERAIALSVIDQLQYDPFLRGLVTLEAVAWDKKGASIPMLAPLTPQDAINLGLPKPSECDIVIVLLWSRIGTPLPPEYRKSDGDRYLSGTEWEYLDALNAFQNSSTQPARPQLLVYRRTDRVLVDINDESFEEKRKQYFLVQSFFKSFANIDGSIKQGYNIYNSPNDFRHQLESHLKQIIQRLLVYSETEKNSLSKKSIKMWSGSPFPGLRAFTPSDAPVFFGREQEINDLLSKLSEPVSRFICIVGASGSGKSSLVNAGLVPRLENGAIQGSKDWIGVRFTPGEVNDDPFASLMHVLYKKIKTIRDKWATEFDLVSALGSNNTFIDELFDLAFKNQPSWAKMLIFIDQFEELFALIDKTQRENFITWLHQATTDERLYFIITVRSDFYQHCVADSKLAGLLITGTYPLAAPGLKALYDMITKPAARAGLEFEKDLPESILVDAGKNPGALALLAYLLDELYHVSLGNKGLLTHKDYNFIGGVQGAIGKRAENIFTNLAPHVQSVFPYIFRELAGVNEFGAYTRRRTLMSQIIENLKMSSKNLDLPTSLYAQSQILNVIIQNQPAADTSLLAQIRKNSLADQNYKDSKIDIDAGIEFVEALTNARLLVKSVSENGETIVEIAHEALLSNWPRLSNWINESQEDLILLRQIQMAAEQWKNNGYSKVFLWPHERLLPVYFMIQRISPGLDRLVLDFIRPESQRLLDEVDKSNPTHFRRATIGDRLGEIGDIRPGVGISHLFDNAKSQQIGVPDIVWCDVPEETIKFKGRPITIKSFKISKYLITYLQYFSFLNSADGFHNQRWWVGMIRPPKTPGQQNRSLANHPAENVSWYDATAFCRWMTAKVGYLIRLPTEWEWELAASGGENTQAFPWGKDWDPSYVNTKESRLYRTVAVGLYPQDTSLYGVMDMAGNIHEWCQNEYDNIENIGIKGGDTRTVRGGSWDSDQGFARNSSRLREYSNTRADNIGFRIVTAL